MNQVELLKLLGPVFDVRQVDVLHALAAIGAVLPFTDLGRTARQPDGNEGRVAVSCDPLDLAKRTTIAGRVVQDMREHEARICRCVISYKCEHSFPDLLDMFPSLFLDRDLVRA